MDEGSVERKDAISVVLMVVILDAAVAAKRVDHKVGSMVQKWGNVSVGD